MRLTAEISVVCLSVCRRTFGRKKLAASIRIRALILHLAGDNLIDSMRITCGSLNDSEARRQEKLRGKRERD